MTLSETLVSLVIACVALYGLGVPVAWLLPAPAESQWVYRIAIGPLYAIVVASFGAWALRTLGVPLHPLQLGALIATLWLLAAWRKRWWWKPSGAPVALPTAMVTAGASIWCFSLLGFGLYLPGRDFKNHAYWVAQVAHLKTSDPSRVLTFSPVGGPDGVIFYPLGLHTLLGWSLPTSTWSSIGVTAGAAVLVTSISLPLAMVTLARLWDPDSVALWSLAGLAGVAFPGFTSGFEIGSVVLLSGTALYAASLACVWSALRSPTPLAVAALGFAALGLFFMHVAEAVGLACVALLAVAVRRSWRLVTPSWSLAAGAAAPLLIGMLVLQESAGRLGDRASADWDIAPNTISPLYAWAVPLLVQPGGPGPLQLVWLCLTFAGLWMVYRHGMDWFPVIALGVVLVLSLLAAARGLPAWLAYLTAPWYGTPSRIALLAAPPIALLGSLVVARLVEARGNRVLVTSGLVGVAIMVSMSVSVAPARRADLRIGLAGAGDTPAVAEELWNIMEPGQTVLNFDGDGTGNLFAFRRIPILDGFRIGLAAGDPADEPIDWVQSKLLQLSDPSVAHRMSQMGVAYIAIGTTTRYRDAEVGYNWQMVARQPEVKPVLVGSDMVILRYRDSS